jgi:predicted nucleic acid-binding protein
MERFWDSSAIVPLLVEEPHSAGARDLYRVNPALVVWQYSQTEVVSALAKLVRQGDLDSTGRDMALRQLDSLATRWIVVQTLDQEALDEERDRAKDLMLKHPLRSGDALQLAAALAYFDPPHKHGFVVVDRMLATVAASEGFSVVRPAERKGGGRGRR